MAGAKLDFSNGYMGVERCTEPGSEKQYLRALIYSKAKGLQTSSPVEIEAVEQFALDVMKQAGFARGYTEDDIVTVGLERIIDEIKAERERAGSH